MSRSRRPPRRGRLCKPRQLRRPPLLRHWITPAVRCAKLGEDPPPSFRDSRDLYAPIALIIAGFVLAFVDASMHEIHNPVMMSVYVAVTTVVNVAMVFAALLAAVQIMGLGLGPLWTALLKIAAVAILPGAVAGIIAHFGMLTWALSAILYYALLSYFFDMEGTEIYLSTAIIWVVRFILSLVFTILILPGGKQNSQNALTAPPSVWPSGSSPAVAPSNPQKPPMALVPRITPTPQEAALTKSRMFPFREEMDMKARENTYEASP